MALRDQLLISSHNFGIIMNVSTRLILSSSGRVEYTVVDGIGMLTKKVSRSIPASTS